MHGGVEQTLKTLFSFDSRIMMTTTMKKYIRMSNLEYKDANTLKRVEDGEGIGKKQTGGNKMAIADIFNSIICYSFFYSFTMSPKNPG